MSAVEDALSGLEGMFQRPGYDFQVRRQRESPYDGGVLVVDLGYGRKRQVIVALYSNGAGCHYYWPKEGPETPVGKATIDNLSDARNFGGFDVKTECGEPAISKLREAITWTVLGDPATPVEETRQILAQIASSPYMVKSWHNASGPEVSALARIVLQLVERVEAIER